MDAVRVMMLREVLAGTELLEATRAFAGALRGSVTRSPRQPGGLLLVGTETYEPWHLAAHLDDEATWCGLPELSPTLVRCHVPRRAPEHLSVGLPRIEAARRGETVLVVAPERASEGLLQRLHDARHTGATVLAMEGGDPDLRALAHEALTVPGPQGCSSPAIPSPGLAASDPAASRPPVAQPSEFDVLQHLVSAAAGEDHPSPSGRPTLLTRLSRLAEQLTSPPPAMHW